MVKYFHTRKGCRRGCKCWFSHCENNNEEKESKKFNLNLNKKVKSEQNQVKERKQEQSSNLQKVMIELLRLLLRYINM